MKKGLVSIFCLLVLTVTAIPAGAQTRFRRTDGRRYEQRLDASRYRNYSGRPYSGWNERPFWDSHRDKITTAAGAGGGALLGAIIGGKKGAILGAIAGGAGAAVYTYGIRDKEDDWRNRRY